MREVRLSYVQDWLMRGCVGPSGDECGSGVDCLSWSGKRATRSNCEASAAGHVAIHFRHFWGLWVGRSTFFITIAQMPVALTPSSPPSFNFFFLLTLITPSTLHHSTYLISLCKNSAAPLFPIFPISNLH